MKIPIKEYWALLNAYLKPQWRMTLFLAILLLGNIALRLITPQIIRSFIDATQAEAASEALFNIALTFLSLALLQQGVAVLSGYLSELVAWTATNALRGDLAAHCLQLDLSFHNARTPGEMIERLDGDINNLANFFSRLVVELGGSILLLMGVLVLLWREDYRVGIGMTAFILVALVITLHSRNIAVPFWAAERQASAEFFGFLEERLAGTEDIRANGAEAYALRNFHGLIRQMLRTSLKAGMKINILLNTLLFLYATGIATALFLAVYLFGKDIITLGTVYLIYSYASMLERPIDSITHELDHLQRAGAGITRIRELLAIQSKINDPDAKKVVVTPCSGDRNIQSTGRLFRRTSLTVQFEKVTFGYDDSISVNEISSKGSTGNHGNGGSPNVEKEIVLRNLSFCLKSGKILGLLGRTGSGKTTLTRLIFRFYDPDTGIVRIGGNEHSDLIDIRQVPVRELRQQIGMVTQNIQLFNTSVRDNLTFFDQSVPDARIERVISDLGLQAWFSSLPEGLDTILESKGGGLSAGEAQLLAFTRIFLADPGLVVLDEASSRLDPATEALIERVVSRLVKDRTAIIIAHRLGTVQKADQIMILEQGTIEEYGERIGLENDPSSRFSKLLQTGLEEVLV
jgi:ATP-binding cassette subfamily B protein